MGICIHLAIAKSVTKKEWENVYEESLKLVTAFPLAEERKVTIDGIDTICLVRTREYGHPYGWNKKEVRMGWDAVGDYEYMRTAEDFFLPREIVRDSEYVEDCEDAMFAVLPACFDFACDDKRFDFVYEEWGDKTQGKPYHMYLLAIACMIESRLGSKAFVYGGITKGQCVKAVSMANSILDKPIEIPSSCDLERLMVRVDTMPISEKEKLHVFESFYLGNKGKEFGDQIRKNFSKKACNAYWKKRFNDFYINQRGFDSSFHDYILWGFDLCNACKYIKFEDTNGITQYERFVRRVMDSKLHIKEKDCTDPLEIDQDVSEPYSVSIYLAQVAFAGAKNKKIDRFIPLEEIRKALVKGIGDKCDVNRIIDEYIQKESEQDIIKIADISTEDEYKKACEQDASSVFKQAMDEKRDQLQKKRELYNISDYDDIIFYKQGDKIFPRLEEALEKSYIFYNSILEEDDYKKLMKKTPQDRCEFLVKRNRTLLIRDRDWRKIFSDIRKNKKSFERYYPMVRVRIDSDGIENMVKAFVLNDELYAYCSVLADKYRGDKVWI